MTTLSFDLDPVDQAVVALLRDISNLGVHIGTVTDSDGNEMTVSAPLPYVLYGSTLGARSSQRMNGWSGTVPTFTTTYTHQSLDGCKAVATSMRAYLDNRAITVGGRVRQIVLDDPAGRVYVAKDTTWTRPGGLPLFFAVDRWNVL